MHRFEVWAPRAGRVAVVSDGQQYEMERSENGWWAAAVESAGAGSRYGFLLDDDTQPLPDPRSMRQPEGVHGLSEVVDHAAFRWTDEQWRPPALGSAIIYELHIGTFTPEGTLESAVARLDYLCDLGVTHLSLMPLASAEGRRGWGYDGAALYAPMEPYGGPDAVKRFVDAAHARGLAVLIDVVYNHFGPSGNYTGRFAPYITESHHTPWGGAVNFEDAGSHEVRRFFTGNALTWLRDYHFDGLRVDAVHAFIDRSARHFLRELEEEVRRLANHTGRRYVVIAESDLNDPRLVTASEAGGYGMDAQWSDDFHHALWAVLTGERTGYYADFGSMADLAKAITQVFVYQGQYSRYRRRAHGKPVAGLPADRFLGYIQNHDQVGNRGGGERLGHVVGQGRVKIAAAMVLLGPFVPMLFAGEEFAASTPFLYFTDFEDKALGEAVSEGRRHEFVAFGWPPEQVPDPQDEQTFLRSRLRWEEAGQGDHAEMLAWHRSLIALRRKEISLTDPDLGQTIVSFDESGKWLRMIRGSVEVAWNAGRAPVTLPISGPRELLLASEAGVRLEAVGLILPPASVAVFRNPDISPGAELA